MKNKVPNLSGLYVVKILSSTPMPVTRDKRYVNMCAKVDKNNVKFGKAKDLALRQKNYWNDFDKENVVFIPLVIIEDIKNAETAVLRHLKEYRLTSPKGGKMDWLENIEIEAIIIEIFLVLKNQEFQYEIVSNI